MEKKKLRRTIYLACFWILFLSVILTTATYAWFTFSPVTNVTPISSTISRGETLLLIANQPDGVYTEECELLLTGSTENLKPLSTADLSAFYKSAGQDRNGISFLFEDASDSVDSSALHGTVYLRCKGADCNVYFYRSGLSLGGDIQTLAALRLGIKLTTPDGTDTRIFTLDALGDTGTATANRTVPVSGTVVANTDDSRKASFVPDPAVGIEDYLAYEQSAGDRKPAAGKTSLCILREGETAVVEYWLYLEGCDDNCIDQVQQREIGLQLAFAGVEIE